MEIVNCSGLTMPVGFNTLTKGAFWRNMDILVGGNTFDEEYLHKLCKTLDPTVFHLFNFEGERDTHRENLSYFTDLDDPSIQNREAVVIKIQIAKFMEEYYPEIKFTLYMLPENSGGAYHNPKKWAIPVVQREVAYIEATEHLPNLCIGAGWGAPVNSVDPKDREKWTTQTEAEIHWARMIHKRNPYVVIRPYKANWGDRNLGWATMKFQLDSLERWGTPAILWDWQGQDSHHWYIKLLLWQYSK